MALGGELTELGYRSVRVYTLAMRFPRMVGKGFNGERLPGGPYTVPQFVGGGMTFGLSGISAYYFPLGNPAINLLIGAGLTFFVGGALAHIPVDGIRITTRLAWIVGLLVSTAPTTTELMPTGSPLAIVGGDVMVLEPYKPPQRQRRAQRAATTRARRDPLAPTSSSSPPPPAPGKPGPATLPAAPAAAAVFGALTGAR